MPATPFRFALRPCSTDSTRFRWTITENNVAIQFSLNSFLSRADATHDAHAVMEGLEKKRQLSSG